MAAAARVRVTAPAAVEQAALQVVAQPTTRAETAMPVAEATVVPVVMEQDLQAVPVALLQTTQAAPMVAVVPAVVTAMEEEEPKVV